jgi:hypothetical protein
MLLIFFHFWFVFVYLSNRFKTYPMTPLGLYMDGGTNRHFAYFYRLLGMIRENGQEIRMPLPSDRFLRVYVDGKCVIYFPYNDENMRNCYLSFVLLKYDFQALISLLQENFRSTACFYT